MNLFAHSIPGASTDSWEPLLCHLQRTAKLAEYFSEQFGAASFGRTLGLLHDLGKIKPEFQAKLLREQNSVSHSGEGALYAYNTIDRGNPGIGKMLAYCIAGHHAGLANGLHRSDNRPTTPLTEFWCYNESSPLCSPSLSRWFSVIRNTLPLLMGDYRRYLAAS